MPRDGARATAETIGLTPLTRPTNSPHPPFFPTNQEFFSPVIPGKNATHHPPTTHQPARLGGTTSITSVARGSGTMSKSRRPANQANQFSDSPIAWFGEMLIARERGDFRRAAEAQGELNRLGWRFRYRKPPRGLPLEEASTR